MNTVFNWGLHFDMIMVDPITQEQFSIHKNCVNMRG